MRRSVVLVLAVNLVAIVAVPAIAQPAATAVEPPTAPTDWYTTLHERLRLYGHRNWIVIVDSAYPAQTSGGVEMLVTNADQLAVVKATLAAIDQQRHVRPKIYVDAELEHVPMGDAQGIDRYRADLSDVLGDRKPTRRPHADLIETIDAAGSKFRVLVLKTNLALPYTSVFIELDCGYWSAEAEARLRSELDAAAP
jgi:L-fucose mutarotase/ribose pyranase (RbsD/FucU family)